MSVEALSYADADKEIEGDLGARPIADLVTYLEDLLPAEFNSEGVREATFCKGDGKGLDWYIVCVQQIKKHEGVKVYGADLFGGSWIQILPNGHVNCHGMDSPMYGRYATEFANQLRDKINQAQPS